MSFQKFHMDCNINSQNPHLEGLFGRKKLDPRLFFCLFRLLFSASDKPF